MGRTDDVINVAGHRLSTGSLEAALAAHPAVAECAVIGVADELKGQVPARPRRAQVRASTRARTVNGSGRARRARARRRSARSPRCSSVDIVAGLPKTRSGKILRRTMRELADGKSPAVPATIEDAVRPRRPRTGPPFPTRLTGAGAERASQAAARGHRNRAVARLRWGVGRPAARVRVRGGG